MHRINISQDFNQLILKYRRYALFDVSNWQMHPIFFFSKELPIMLLHPIFLHCCCVAELESYKTDLITIIDNVVLVVDVVIVTTDCDDDIGGCGVAVDGVRTFAANVLGVDGLGDFVLDVLWTTDIFHSRIRARLDYTVIGVGSDRDAKCALIIKLLTRKLLIIPAHSELPVGSGR